MKLYIYENCPFCVRARMIFGLKKLNVEKIALQQDDNDTPIKLVGKKSVPIFDNDEGVIMPESLDIVRYVDSHYGTPILRDSIRPEIQQWADSVAYTYKMYFPRFAKLKLAEHQTPSALRYYIESKTKWLGNFDELYAKTTQFLNQLDEDLAKLESLMLGDESIADVLSMEDILIFPTLRNLTVVKGVKFPPKIQHYVETMAKKADVDLFWERAV